MGVTVQTACFDSGALLNALHGERLGVGGVVGFVGYVRDFNDGEEVAGMLLEHYPGMTEKALQKIVDEASQRWPLLRAEVLHRVGRLEPGEPAAHPRLRGHGSGHVLRHGRSPPLRCSVANLISLAGRAAGPGARLNPREAHRAAVPAAAAARRACGAGHPRPPGPVPVAAPGVLPAAVPGARRDVRRGRPPWRRPRGAPCRGWRARRRCGCARDARRTAAPPGAGTPRAGPGRSPKQGLA